MRLFLVQPEGFTELAAPPDRLPDSGFLWIGCTRDEFEPSIPELQHRLANWGAGALVELHLSDLLNPQLPSHFDYTSWYDLLVFRRLLPADAPTEPAEPPPGRRLAAPGVAVETSAVGFAIHDRVLLTVHPLDCPVREHFAQRLATLSAGRDLRNARLPASPADLMLRMVNHMVDGYLELRRRLTRQLGDLQHELLDARSAFSDWPLLLESRNTLTLLEDICEDQRSAVQEWIDALDEWPAEPTDQQRRERELLRVRSRDVLEHVERVLTHVRRLEQSAEAAVQMHFSALGHRTNNIMRTLTVLTAIFLPLNLITGFFGMNFDSLPLIHTRSGVWLATLAMLLVAGGLGAFFWRRRYLSNRSKR